MAFYRKQFEIREEERFLDCLEKWSDSKTQEFLLLEKDVSVQERGNAKRIAVAVTQLRKKSICVLFTEGMLARCTVLCVLPAPWCIYLPQTVPDTSSIISLNSSLVVFSTKAQAGPQRPPNTQ